MANKNDFSFDSYNELMKGIGAGLKLHLAEQLMTDVMTTAIRFDNPLLGDIMTVKKATTTLLKDWKAQAAQHKIEQANKEKGGSPIIVNAKESLVIH